MKKLLPAIFVSILFLTLTACESKFAKPENCVGEGCGEPQTMKVDAPIISPNGGSHPAGEPISISSSTGGAKIIYTLDGSDPKANEDGSLINGVLYQAEIPLNVTKIKAVAIKEGMQDSEITESNYSVTAPNSPTFNPVGGTYNLNTFPVSLVAPAHGCDEMRYTKSVNNSEPAEHVYSNAIDVTDTNTTIGAVCIKAGISSPESFATYILKVPTPSIQHITCPTIPVCPNPNSGPSLPSTPGVSFNFIDSLHAQGNIGTFNGVTKVITCTGCLQITSTINSTKKWRYTHPDTNQLGGAVYKSQWYTYSDPIPCCTIAPGMTDFTVEFRAENTPTMTPSDLVSQKCKR